MTTAWMGRPRDRDLPESPARLWQSRAQALGLQPFPPKHVVAPSAPAYNLSLPLRYLEAVRRLKAEGHRFPRTIHMTFVPGRGGSVRGTFGGGSVWGTSLSSPVPLYR